MKQKIILLLAGLIITGTAAQAAEYLFTTSQGHFVFQCEKDGNGRVEITFSANGITVRRATRVGRNYRFFRQLRRKDVSKETALIFARYGCDEITKDEIDF